MTPPESLFERIKYECFSPSSERYMSCQENRLEQICAEFEQRLREVEAYARRYRWLREEARTGFGEPFIARSFASGISAWTKEFADRAIDEAMELTIPQPEKKHGQE